MKKVLILAVFVLALSGCGSSKNESEPQTTQAAGDKYSFAEDAVNKMAAEDSLNINEDYGAGMSDEQREAVQAQIEAAKMMDPEYAQSK